MALNYPKDFGTEWMNLKRQVADAFTSANSRVPYAKIGAGILQVFTSLQMQAGAYASFKHSNGATAMFVGRHTTGGDEADGMYMRRRDGSLAFWTYQKSVDGYGYTAIYDQEVNIIVSDDAGSGKGLARPWIPVLFQDYNEIANPPGNRLTANTTDTNVIMGYYNIQHPKLQYVMYVTAPTSTCEVKFWESQSGTLIHSTTLGDGWAVGTITVPTWDFGEDYYIRISIRRASGTGNVGLTLVSLQARQT